MDLLCNIIQDTDTVDDNDDVNNLNSPSMTLFDVILSVTIYLVLAVLLSDPCVRCPLGNVHYHTDRLLQQAVSRCSDQPSCYTVHNYTYLSATL